MIVTHARVDIFVMSAPAPAAAAMSHEIGKQKKNILPYFEKLRPKNANFTVPFDRMPETRCDSNLSIVTNYLTLYFRADVSSLGTRGIVYLDSARGSRIE